MSIRFASHIYRNCRGTLYFKFVVPLDLLIRVGQRSMRFSLGTDQRQPATMEAMLLIQQMNLIPRMRGLLTWLSQFLQR